MMIYIYEIDSYDLSDWFNIDKQPKINSRILGYIVKAYILLISVLKEVKPNEEINFENSSLDIWYLPTLSKNYYDLVIRFNPYDCGFLITNQDLTEYKLIKKCESF